MHFERDVEMKLAATSVTLRYTNTLGPSGVGSVHLILCLHGQHPFQHLMRHSLMQHHSMLPSTYLAVVAVVLVVSWQWNRACT